MKNRISGLLHQYHVGMLQGRWSPWKVGFFELNVDKRYLYRDMFSGQVYLVYNSLSKPIKQWSITDTEVYLSYLICIGWIKGLYTNIVMIQRS